MAFGSRVTVASPGCTQLMSRVTSRFCEESERRSEVRPRRRTLTVSATGVVMTRSRGMRTNDTGTANARSDTGSRRGAETTTHTVRARKRERALSQRLDKPFIVCRLSVVGCQLSVVDNRQLSVQSFLHERPQRLRIEILPQHSLARGGDRSVLLGDDHDEGVAVFAQAQ